MRIRRIVPSEGQLFRYRRTPGEKQLQPASPVSEIRETYDHLFPHTQQFLKHDLRILKRLHRLRQYHIIEAFVVAIFKAVFDVILQDRQTLCHARKHQILFKFDTLGIDILIRSQTSKKFTVTAAYIQNRTIRLYQRFYQLVVNTRAPRLIVMA